MKKIILDCLRLYWIHIIVWIIFIFYETVMVGLIASAWGNPINYIVHYSIIITYFYLSAGRVLPWALNFKISAFWKVPVAYFILLASFVLANFGVDTFLVHYKIVKQSTAITLDFMYTVLVVYRGIYFLGFATGYLLLVKFIDVRKKSQELERQRLHNIIKEERMMRALSKAQNDYLKAQINPHFLFNTLDFVYHNVSEHSPDAGDAIITLSEMMRYAIATNDIDEFILLGDEIEQAEKLIYLYQLRKNHELNIQTLFSEEARNLKFIPLVLLTLVENVFKHGHVNDQVFGTSISAVVENDQLLIKVKNGLNERKQTSGGQSGLRNIKNRLHFAYGDGVTFKAEKEAHYFLVSIRVELSRIRAGEEPRRIRAHQSN